MNGTGMFAVVWSTIWKKNEELLQLSGGSSKVKARMCKNQYKQNIWLFLLLKICMGIIVNGDEIIRITKLFYYFLIILIIINLIKLNLNCNRFLLRLVHRGKFWLFLHPNQNSRVPPYIPSHIFYFWKVNFKQKLKKK